MSRQIYKQKKTRKTAQDEEYVLEQRLPGVLIETEAYNWQIYKQKKTQKTHKDKEYVLEQRLPGVLIEVVHARGTNSFFEQMLSKTSARLHTGILKTFLRRGYGS